VLQKMIATLVSSVLISTTVLGACMTSQTEEEAAARAITGSRETPQPTVTAAAFDPYIDCHRPAEDVLAQLGLLSDFEQAPGYEEKMAVLAQVAGLCDGIPDAPGADTPPKMLPDSPVPEVLPDSPVSDDLARYSPAGETLGDAPAAYAMADAGDLILKCILAAIGADVAMDVYEAIKPPWRAGLRGRALVADAAEILWNRVKRKGFKYALKALGGVGAAIACFIEIVSVNGACSAGTEVALVFPRVTIGAEGMTFEASAS
jgi:hypothetical protein